MAAYSPGDNRFGALANEFEMELSGEFEHSIGEDIEVTADGLIADSLQRIKRLEGVTALVIMNTDGEIVRTSLEHAEASRRGLAALELQKRAQDLFAAASLSRAGREDELSGGGSGPEKLEMLRIRTRKEDLVLTCSDKFAMLVVQKSQAS
ncbi:hypothetical protein T492DRAFT_903119 [Pavlovales sp. CCMP2436]|nr:hypothetical protein T492DRAFT_903119 [Pavlovales sp. CCMP2436]|mmetsp:Transcript_5050/g.13386  ORF Transcript_5050/g.13386 Transcript_5050/m.13386 type:complete len:151 (-) Transcript_5050:210-662(-)